MAQTRKKIPLFLLFKETDRLEDVESFQSKLGLLYNQGVRIINQSSELLDQYWALPNIKTQNGPVKGNDPLQICYILKTALDNLDPDYLVNQTQIIQTAVNRLPPGGRAVKFPNESILLVQGALFEIVYAYIQSNPALFSKCDLNFLNTNPDVPYFQAFLSKNATLPFVNNPDPFFACLHKILCKDQSNINAYLELVQLVYPDQMPKNEISPTTTAGQAPELLLTQSSSLFAPASGNQEVEEKKAISKFPG